MKKNLLSAAVVAASLLFAAGAQAAEHGHHGAHWGYSGHEGPEHWGDMQHEFAACKEGHQQSPINIDSKAAAAADLPAITINYKATAYDVVNNGHTIQVNVPKGNSITVGEKSYDLLQFHFHAPSEHTVDGKPGDMVVHFVHKDADGKLGVIDVMLDKGAANALVGTVWTQMPAHSGEAKGTGTINPADLIPAGRAYYAYAGSLTTPPCTEGVSWMVMADRLTVSADQVKAFTAIFPHNARPVQPMHGRAIKVSH